ncbi:MAG: type I 3-dehydroquinate dehydratase [Aquificota bacterium]|nr:type I 3-dehydroquinate dehydratase [Aquificota bacterium]
MLIAVPLTDEGFREKVKEAREKGADIVELRVDLFSRRDPDHVLDLLMFAKESGLKTILTVRSPEEGGGEVENRKEIYEKVAPYSDFADVELSSRNLIPYVREALSKGGGRLIVSFHDFERTPPSWVIREVLREGFRYGGIPKVAVKANSYGDVARLLCVGSQEKGDKILIAMGDLGRVSRVAGFVFGSLITYATLGRPLAPGQLGLEETVKLRELLYKP